MTQDNNWPCLEASLGQYSYLFNAHVENLIDAFSLFLDKVTQENNPPPKTMLIHAFYAAITDLNNQLGAEAEEQEEAGDVERTTFEELGVGDYFLHGGAPCCKGSNNYSLNDFNALDLLRNTPIGVPASTNVFRAAGKLEEYCQQLYQIFVHDNKL